MTASIKLLSVLISLAMMLTGTYGAEAPEPAARTLTLSDITIGVNGETVTLNPTLSLGAASEAGKALYEAALNLDGRELFPFQVSVTEDALTALLKNADVSVTLPEAAISSLTEAAAGQVDLSADADSAALVQFLSKELIPAYVKVLKKAADPEFQKQASAMSDALLDQVVDRGAGTPDVLELEDGTYSVTAYTYSLTTEQLAELIDLVYSSDEDLYALYQAIFKLYAMLPEESGLNGIESYADIFEATGIEMTANIVERRNDDGTVQDTDLQMVIDFSGAIGSAIVEDAEEDDEDDTAVGMIGGSDGPAATFVTGDGQGIQPMVIDVHSTREGDRLSSHMSSDYEMDDLTMTMEGDTTRESDVASMDLQMTMSAADEVDMEYEISCVIEPTAAQFDADLRMETGDSEGFSMSCEYAGGAQADTADWDYRLLADMEIVDDDTNVSGSLSLDGVKRGDGTAHTTIGFGAGAEGLTLGLTFDADVSNEAIEDVATGHDGLRIDDLSDVNGIMEDSANQGLLMQALGSLQVDVGALMGDESVVALMNLFERAASGELTNELVDEDKVAPDGMEPDDFEDEDVDAAEEAMDDIESEYIEYSDSLETDGGELEPEPEDDGVLPFEEPVFGYLPEGMKVVDSDVNTAYDSVNLTVSDENYDSIIMGVFTARPESALPSYTMDAEGNLQQADDSAVQISQTDEDSWIVSFVRDGVAVELYITSATLDAPAIAQIVNGLTF